MTQPVIIGNATLYNADCMDVLPVLRADVLVTDHPYGVSGQQNTRNADRECGRKNAYGTFADSPGYVESVVIPAVHMALSRVKRGVITPGNRCLTLYPSPQSFGCFYQPASVGLQPWGRADSQPILYYGKHPVGGTALPGSRCSYQLTEAPEVNGHPCPKPIRAMTALVAASSLPNETVLDPFMGSGTTGVAAVQLGRKFIGIEIHKPYFDIARERIENAQRQLNLLDVA